MGVAALGLAWMARPTRPAADTPPKLARWVGQLGARPALHQRLAERLGNWSPPLGRRLPEFLRSDTLERRRLDACHRLLALGARARPAVPVLERVFLSGFRDGNHTISLYAFLALHGCGVSAEELLDGMRQRPRGVEQTIRFCASLLTTEDEQLRDFAWQCLEAAGPGARIAEARLRDLTDEGDPALRQRARHLLARLDNSGNASDAGAPEAPP